MIEFRKASLADLTICAPFIWKSSEEFLDAIFTLGHISFKDFIAYDFAQGRGIFGHKNLNVAQSDGKTLGVLTFYKGSQFKQIAKFSLLSILKFYGPIKSLIILKRMVGLMSLFDTPSPNCVFIANGYVDESCRIPGVFSGLINLAEEFAQANELNCIECDISFRNDRSLKVHQFFGFRVINKNEYNGNNKKFDGFIRMRLLLDDESEEVL
jgi:hypothetical protein